MMPAAVSRCRTIGGLKVSRRLGGRQAFPIEDRGDRGAAVACPMQVGGASNQSGVGAERFHPRDRAHQRMGRLVATMPVAFQPDLFTAVDNGDQNPLQQQPHDGLALFTGCRRRLPQGGQIVCQLADRSNLGRTG